jgi:hypothetical protein
MLLIPVEVRPSPIHGLGVFAASFVPAAAVVWQFDPGIDQRHTVAWLEEQPEHVRAYVETHCVLSLDRRHYLVLGDHTVFVNHSVRANLVSLDDVQVNGDGIVVAAREIAAGEELTIDYTTIDGGDRERMSAGLELFSPTQQAAGPGALSRAGGSRTRPRRASTPPATAPRPRA